MFYLNSRNTQFKVEFSLTGKCKTYLNTMLILLSWSMLYFDLFLQIIHGITKL